MQNQPLASPSYQIGTIEFPINNFFFYPSVKSLTIFLASLFFFFYLYADNNSIEDHHLDIVTSWDEYVSLNQKQQAFGIWSYNGKTDNVRDGIPESVDYNHTFTCQLSLDGSKILSSRVMKTKDGSILSIVSQMETWDPERQKIFSIASGFDGGELYRGSYELVKINGAEENWNYTETISAQTHRVIITWEVGGADKRKWTATRSNNPDKSSTRIFKRQKSKLSAFVGGNAT